MTEVLKTLVPMFWERGLEMVWADVEKGNWACRGLLGKVGFAVMGENVAEGGSGSLRMELRKGERGGEEVGGNGDGEEGDGGT